MINSARNFICSPTLTNISQSTNASVTFETTLKALWRPGFILIDNRIDTKTKKYVATKEFLYQATCLLAKHIIFKDCPEFMHFKNENEYLSYHHLTEKSLRNRITTLMKDHSCGIFNYVLRKELMTKEKPNPFNLIKGTIELGSIIGSVLGLAILAPQISHATIHPALRFLCLKKINSNFIFQGFYTCGILTK